MTNDDSTSKDKSAGWVMPEPVFRTSEGHTPGSGKTADEEVDTLETDIENGDVVGSQTEIADVSPAIDTPGQKSGCFRSFLFILLVITLLGVALVVGLAYLLTSWRPADTAF